MDLMIIGFFLININLRETKVKGIGKKMLVTRGRC